MILLGVQHELFEHLLLQSTALYLWRQRFLTLASVSTVAMPLLPADV